MTRHPLFWLPNALTVLRCFSGVLIAWMIYRIALHEQSLSTAMQLPPDAETAHMMISMRFRQVWGGAAFVMFALSSLTDWLDGYLARKWQAESAFGRLLDPIADKIIVGLPFLTIAWAAGWALPIALPVFVIVGRDVLITMLRFAGLGAGTMKVSYIAKFKTFLEMILLALFLFALAMLTPGTALSGALMTTWMFGLWGVAVLSAWTGLGYLLRLIPKKETNDGAD